MSMGRGMNRLLRGVGCTDLFRMRYGETALQRVWRQSGINWALTLPCGYLPLKSGFAATLKQRVGEP